MRSFASRALAALLLLAPVTAARADTPVALRESFAGPLDVAGTAGTLRRFSNLLDACAVDDHGSAPLTGIPAGATVVSATLYWAGSWSTAPGSGQRVPDWDVSLDGLPLSAERRYTARYSTGGVDFDFFQGVADVTSHVAARGNGLYQFAGLSVNDGPPHCASQAVLAGWSLMVVYSAPGEPLRVVNRYDGLQALRGEQVTLQPNNFRIPQNGRDGRFAVLSWEGDEENSQNMGGVRETLSFNRRPLRDRINPVNNPYNSTANWINDPTTWGLDFDVFDVGSRLGAGDDSAEAVYSTGGDLVLLGAELLCVANTAVADLTPTLAAAGSFPLGGEGTLALGVDNLGPSAADDATLSLLLPAGLTAVASDAPGWTYDASGAPLLRWTLAQPIAVGAAAPPIALTVAVAPNAPASLLLTATVASSTFDNIAGNNVVTLSVATGGALPDLVMLKQVQVVADPVNGGANPKGIPGARVDYSLRVSNLGPGETDAGSLAIVDALPAGLSLFVGDLVGGAPLQFTDGVTPSGLSVVFSALDDPTDDLDFSADGGASYGYVPVPDADGFDPAVTHLRVRPRGRFAGMGGAPPPPGPPSCTLRFRARVR
ncbi:MAG: hypothetical protein R3C71_13275 [Candidatus Krumholzibacteriia bacterium]